MTIRFKKLDERAKLPKRGEPNAAGFDLYACENTSLPSCPREIINALGVSGSIVSVDGSWLAQFVRPVLVRTGLTWECPTEYYGQIFDRSSMGFKGIHVFAGVIDPDYRKEIGVVMMNFSSDSYAIAEGDRVAQMVILPRYTGEACIVDDVSQTNRDGGFGSTGR